MKFNNTDRRTELR